MGGPSRAHGSKSRGLRSLAWVAALALAPLAGAAPTWEEASSDAGIVFQTAGEIHPNEFDIFWPAAPEIMGVGACFADLDGDGYDDLVLVNQKYNPENPAYGDWAEDVDVRNRVFLNQGDGTFADVTDGSGLDVANFGYGCNAADYDGDGCADVFVSNFGPSELFLGACDGTFGNATALLGPVGQPGYCGDWECMSTGVGTGDYDNDGDLDIYVGNYVNTNLTDAARGPIGHVAQHNFLLRNDLPAGFTDVALQAGVAGQATDENGSKSFQTTWFDADLDGDLELFVANDEEPDDYYINNGDGTFTDWSNESGLDDPRAGMGLTIADYDNDGLPDLFFTHYQAEDNGFYRNLGNHEYEDRSGEDDLHDAYMNVGWGTAFADIDRDADLDLLVANGHTEWIAPNYGQPIQVYRNDPPEAGEPAWNRTWVNVTDASGADLAAAFVHRGLAVADVDFDGDLDMATGNNGNQTAQFLRGDGVENHWLYLRLRQPGMNRDAIGARVVLEAGGVVQAREVQAGASFLSQNSLVLDFGLGAATQADKITIHWPGGGVSVLTSGLAADRLLRYDRATGVLASDALAPRTTTTLAGTGQHGWFRGDVVATVAAEDRNVGPPSGLDATLVRLDDAAFEPYAGAITITEEGPHALRARSSDLAGNLEPVRTTRFGIDRTPPTPAHAAEGTLGEQGWFTGAPTVTLQALDSLSGPGAIRYRVDGGAWTDYGAPFALEEDGERLVEFVAADRAGNEAAPAAFTVRVDRTPPSVQATSPAAGGTYLGPDRVLMVPEGQAALVLMADLLGAGNPDFPLAADAADAASGVAAVAFRVDGHQLSADPDAPFEAAWPAGAAALGLHHVEADAVDVAGNHRVAAVRVLLLPATMAGLAATAAQGPAVHPGPLPTLPEVEPPEPPQLPGNPGHPGGGGLVPGLALPLPLALLLPLVARRRR